jgi:hypothetical protein
MCRTTFWVLFVGIGRLFKMKFKSIKILKTSSPHPKKQFLAGANPTIASYNADDVNVYSASNGMVRFLEIILL